MKRYFGASIILTAALLISTGCQSRPSLSSKNVNVQSSSGISAAPESYDQEVLAQADFAKDFTDINNLKADATIVAEGTVLSTEVFVHNVGDDAVPYTLAHLKVSQVFWSA